MKLPLHGFIQDVTNKGQAKLHNIPEARILKNTHLDYPVMYGPYHILTVPYTACAVAFIMHLCKCNLLLCIAHAGVQPQIRVLSLELYTRTTMIGCIALFAMSDIYDFYHKNGGKR
eukprot:764426-Hanusia_phi.AAC.2